MLIRLCLLKCIRKVNNIVILVGRCVDSIVKGGCEGWLRRGDNVGSVVSRV